MGSTQSQSTPPEELHGLKKKGSCRAQFVMENIGNISDFYHIGEPSCGTMCQATSKSTSMTSLIKTVSKYRMSEKKMEGLRQMIAIMKRMDHPNILRLRETFEDPRNIHLVMEFCGGSDLFDRVCDGHFKEAQAVVVMQQLVRAVHYMHGRNVCHRDLKLENMLLTTDCVETSQLKIIDFGLSRQFEPGQVLTTRAGSPYYVAPEVMRGRYNELVDMWSCGVIMYIMLCGYPPFDGSTDQGVLNRVQMGTLFFALPDWEDVSNDAKGLIKMLLTRKTEERYTAEMALNHHWIKSAPRVEFHGQGFVNNLRRFRFQSMLKKAALRIIAGQSGDDLIAELRVLFMSLDHNSDGLLTAAEVEEGIRRAGFNDDAEIREVIVGMDSDGTGVIDYTEFLAAALDKSLYLQEHVCWAAFRVFDRNGDGRISVTELQQLLNSEETMDDLLEQVDRDKDHTIDFGEFMRMMRRCPGGESRKSGTDGVVGPAGGAIASAAAAGGHFVGSGVVGKYSGSKAVYSASPNPTGGAVVGAVGLGYSQAPGGVPESTAYGGAGRAHPKRLPTSRW